MEENQVSRTALLTAYYRAYALQEVPKIFDDYLACYFLGEKERALFEQEKLILLQTLNSFRPTLASSFPDQAAALAWVMQAASPASLILSRARYAEDNLEEAVRRGVKQYVILGAGMDTFAFRHPKLVKQLQVFEVDHPATQDYKRKRLAELGWEQPTQLHFIPLDFTQGNLEEVLSRSSYDIKALSFFSWLGVTYYLSLDTAFSMFRTIANLAPAGSMLIFDYYDTDIFVPEKAARWVKSAMEQVSELSEPLKTGLDPVMLANNLSHNGLSLCENLSPFDIQTRYFQGRKDHYHALEHAHFACAMVDENTPEKL